MTGMVVVVAVAGGGVWWLLGRSCGGWINWGGTSAVLVCARVCTRIADSPATSIRRESLREFEEQRRELTHTDHFSLIIKHNFIDKDIHGVCLRGLG